MHTWSPLTKRLAMWLDMWLIRVMGTSGLGAVPPRLRVMRLNSQHATQSSPARWFRHSSLEAHRTSLLMATLQQAVACFLKEAQAQAQPCRTPEVLSDSRSAVSVNDRRHASHGKGHAGSGGMRIPQRDVT